MLTHIFRLEVAEEKKFPTRIYEISFPSFNVNSPSDSSLQLFREFFLAALLFLGAVSSNDGRWCSALEFWSSVVCSMENSKVVNVHGVLDSNKEPTLFERCLKAFTHSVAQKCETTILLKTHVLGERAKNTSFADDNSIVRRAVERSLIWESSSDALLSPATSSAGERIRARNVKAFGGNTWNVHVILTSDVRSLEQISKNGSTFEWNARDRFVVLIARREKHGRLSVESRSKIDDVLRTLWAERKVHRVSVSEAILVNDTIPITQVVRTYNPFAKVNDSGL